MKKLMFVFLVLLSVFHVEAGNSIIRVSTDNIDLVFKTGNDGRLYQSYFGKKLHHESDMEHLSMVKEAYITSGMEDYFEPALHVVHNDGNPSTLLKYESHSVSELGDGVTETVITLKDDKYPLTVKLFYTAYQKEDVIKASTEISHNEKKPVELVRYASNMLHIDREKYYLTEFCGDWASEVKMKEQKLEFGKKIVDTKLGTRANMFCSPLFHLALDNTSDENHGEVITGTLGWTGNFRFTFEVDNENRLRIISGINPYASIYHLQPKEVFKTPDFYFTYSSQGVGEASRNFHDWARNHQIKNPNQERMTLLNNWEATYFDFDENKLVGLMDDAVKLGVDMFLLDDGWFGNKHPRSGDHQGLGDWDETKGKLPNGIGYLTRKAKEKGIKFGLWIEPEMVNPKSELYENHKDWVIHLPNRKEYYFRNQMVLDLSNPEVQDYVFGIVDKLKTKYPDIAYFKWDCNSPITNIYSEHLGKNQSHLYVDYVKGLYNVLKRIDEKYPDLPMMLCSGGGGRTDFEALKYFTEFWCSDNTDPIERLFIQWGYSQVFPAKTMCAHVTTWNNSTSIKFRTDVAMMCKMGFDIKLSDMSEKDVEFCQSAVSNYNALKSVILDGDQYRLVSPYKGNHTSTMYVSKDKKKAVMFAFDIYPRYAEKSLPVLLQGLDKDKMYKVKETNIYVGGKSSLKANGKTYSGEYLMNAGLDVFTSRKLNSRVIEIEEM